MMLRNIQIAFHSLGRDVKMLIISVIRQKLEYAEVIKFPHKKEGKKAHVKIGNNTANCN